MLKRSDREQRNEAMRPLFHPTFGSRPAQIVGRDQVLEDYIEWELLERAADATEGYPYLMQLIGFYMVQQAQTGQRIEEEELENVIREAREDLNQSVFAPILSPLSEGDLAFLRAMAEDASVSRMADIGKRRKKNRNQSQ